MITHTAFFGDAERTFALTDDMVAELERLSGAGIGALYTRAISMQFALRDVVEIIRLGLIGGGATPQQAHQLVETYAKNRPMAETYPLALDVLTARWTGPETENTPE